MNLTELLFSKAAELPRTRQTFPFVPFLQQGLESYNAAILALTGSDRLTASVKANAAAIQSLGSSILDAALRYLSGSPEACYRQMEQALLNIGAFIEHLITPPLPETALGRLYRVRDSKGAVLGSRDMYHISFESRDRVATQRYSIPGFPTLYLGSSVWVCWNELNRFDLNGMAMVRIEARGAIRFLDLAYNPLVVAGFIQDYGFLNDRVTDQRFSDFVLAQIVCWPLVFACSCAVHKPDSPFKPEYIVPQTLLQVIRNRPDIDGIRYFSMHLPPNTSFALGSNYAFPVKSNSESGFCPVLTGKFHISDVLFWQTARTLRRYPERSLPGHDNVINLLNRRQVQYSLTDFAAMENLLHDYICDNNVNLA